jgi:hypothetical protein
MALVTDIKLLVGNSRLFVDGEKLKKAQGEQGQGKRGMVKQKWKDRRGAGKRDRVKIGQGGTLDPLADGVLGVHVVTSRRLHIFMPCMRTVIGIGKGTKHLSQFLDCVKVLLPADRVMNGRPTHKSIRNTKQLVYWEWRQIPTTVKALEYEPPRSIT